MMSKKVLESVPQVFTGGWIYTGDALHPQWGGVAVQDGRIVSLDAERITRLTTSGAEIVHLDGRMLMAGFHDAHIHPVIAGVEMLGCDLSACESADEALGAISKYAAKHPELEWITGGGWSMSSFPGGNPTREMLDSVVPDRPVLLENRDHHSAWANTRAFATAGIRATTPDPVDGRFEREADGFPAGTMHDGAIFLFDRVRPAIEHVRAYAGLLAAQAHLFSLGITGWQDAAIGAIMGQPDTVPVYLEALEKGTLQARVRGAQWWDRTAGISQLDRMRDRALHVEANLSRERFSLGTVKIMVDGVAESRTAAMHGPYRDSHGSPLESTGMVFFEPQQLAEYVTAIDAVGLQIHFHTLGDRAVSDALNALAAARSANGPSLLRHHLAHLEVVSEADLPRFVELGVSANVQPYWAAHDAQLDDLVIPFLPSGAEEKLYPFGSLAQAGVDLAMGSDWPVSSPDPLQAIHVAVNRRHARSHAKALHAKEALSLTQALNAATFGSAYVNHLDDVCGRIRPGMNADLAIMDSNLFSLPADELYTARVDETWIGGERVYARGDSSR